LTTRRTLLKCEKSCVLKKQPIGAQFMKNVYEVLRQKEMELTRLEKEVEALRLVAPLLSEEKEMNGIWLSQCCRLRSMGRSRLFAYRRHLWCRQRSPCALRDGTIPRSVGRSRVVT